MKSETEFFTKEGFPMQVCKRCHGSGRYSFNTITGDRCFGCLGSGKQIAKRASDGYNAYQDYKKSLAKPTVKNLSVGDQIAHDHNWKVVVSLVETDEVCGELKSGNNPIVYDYFWIVELEDGTKLKDNGNLVVRRRVGKYDAQPFLAMIKAK